MPKSVWKGVLARDQISSRAELTTALGSPETSYSRSFKNTFDGRPATVYDPHHSQSQHRSNTSPNKMSTWSGPSGGSRTAGEQGNAFGKSSEK